MLSTAKQYNGTRKNAIWNSDTAPLSNTKANCENNNIHFVIPCYHKINNKTDICFCENNKSQME